ncbi:hypothetical protein M0R45_036392 [Rubus argutus]|uniref:Uncharacterized protein n=1 Tax=Rubus argutus TaxID=59490 RepID=A0AAW1VXR2_RUBAR
MRMKTGLSGLICNRKMRVVGLDLQLEYEYGEDHVRVLPAVLGEAKPIRVGPMAEIGGEKLRCGFGHEQLENLIEFCCSVVVELRL